MVSQAEFVSQFQEDMQEHLKRAQALIDSFVINPAEPPVEVTPYEVIWKRGKVRLLRYGERDQVKYRTPYLIVPWLGISRPYVLDLLPGNSMIEYLTNQGHDVFLLDWGEIAAEDKDLGFEQAVFNLLPRAVDRALEAVNGQKITLNGICLGGTLSATYLATHPDAPVENFVAIVAPINFEEGGMFRVWLDERYFPADLIVEHYGVLPANLMGAGIQDAEADAGRAGAVRPVGQREPAGLRGQLQGDEPVGQRLHRDAGTVLRAVVEADVRQEPVGQRRVCAERAQG